MKILNEKLIFDSSVKRKLFFPILLGSLGVFFSILVPMNFKLIIDSISKGQGLKLNIVVAIFILIFLQLALQISSDYYLQKIGIFTVSNLRKKLISKILSLKKKYFDMSLSGDISSILVNDTSALFHLLSTTIPTMINSTISVIVITTMLFYLSFKLSIVILLLLPIIAIIYLPLGKYLATVSLQFQDEIGKLNHYSQFITNENSFIKTAATQEIEYSKGTNIVFNLTSIGLKQAKVYAVTTPLLMTITIFGALSVITYGLYLVQQNYLSIGSFIAYITLFIQIISPLGAVGNAFAHMKGIDGAAKRIIKIFNTDEDEHKSDFDKLDFNELTFNNVSFSYRENSDNILNNLSFSCKVGETIALVGPSGSGKTTVLSLIEQLYSINEGDILIDNHKISSVSLDYLRSQMGYVSQQYPVILGTIRDNLIYGIRNKVISDDELISFSKLTNFFEVINNLSDGLDTFVGDKGVLLSEGQKQRLVLTRTLLLDPKILLLDEVTSSLDSHSEKIIQNTLGEFSTNRIVITIAHRLSTIQKADCILFLENGKITGSGTHEELRKKHALYDSFVKNQFKEIDL